MLGKSIYWPTIKPVNVMESNGLSLLLSHVGTFYQFSIAILLLFMEALLAI